MNEANWTAYKEGDYVPVARYFWVKMKFYLIVATHDGFNFCDIADGDSVSDLVTHYIPIATPELPK